MLQSQNHNSAHPDGKTQLDQMLSGGGEMGALIRMFDWANTPLGAIEMWPQSLRTAVSICLFSRFPIHIWWGPDFVEIYNDAYRPILGNTKHPASLGKPGIVTSAEIWHIIGPMLRNVYENAVSTWSDNLMLPMERYGFTEETYFTLSYSPIFVEMGHVGGIFTVVTETTPQVIGERRLRTLHRLSERGIDAKTAEDACLRAAETLAGNREDIPFALIYLLNESETEARLICSSGIETDSALNPPVIDLTTPISSPWQLRELLASGKIARITNLAENFNTLPPSPWEEHPHTALVLPILSSGGSKIVGFLIGGISARLALDEDYQHFYELIAGHVSTAVANARSYEEERRRIHALAEIDRAKTAFFSNVSHEFRTPLTLMLNPLQEALREAEIRPAEQRENLEIAYRNSLRLQKLVNTLLDFSRIQSNRTRASFVPTDLAVFTGDLASSFRSVIEHAGLRLVIDCPPLPEPVYVDQEMWEKIVLNLLSNAFKFTFDGEIRVSLRTVDHAVELHVQDTGIGIAESDLPHIFERFHRVRGARSRTYEGSGIGLALVAELARFHGGQIGVTSTPDVGTTFTVSIPLGTTHLPQDQISAPRVLTSTAVSADSYTEEALRWLRDEERIEQQTAEQNALSPFDKTEMITTYLRTYANMKILVVDDNADMRDYLRRLLEPYYQVETANDGLAALNRIEAQFPDLVITDIMMPNLDGLGLLERLRSNEQTRTIPVLLLSARAGEEARIEGLQAGADDYLTKPFSARELLARVEAQLKLLQLRRSVIERDTFRLALSDMLRQLTNTQKMKAEAARLLGQHLRASRVHYGEITPSGDYIVVEDSYSDGVSALSGQFKVTDFGAPLVNALRDRRTTVLTHIDSSAALSDEVRTAYTAISVAAQICVPLMTANQAAAVLLVHQADARRWQADEIALIEETAERTWSAVERARAEAALRSSQALLQKAFAIETVGILFFNLDGRITGANETFVRMSGYSREELLSSDHWEMLTPVEFTTVTARAAEELATKGETAPYEKQLVRKDGSRWWGLFAPTRLNESTMECVEFVLDITERKSAEDATRLLQSLAAELSAQTTQKAMAAAIIRAVQEAVGESTASVYLLSPDGQALERLSTEGVTEAYRQQFNQIPLTTILPATDALRTRQSIWLSSQQAHIRLYPHLRELITQNNVQAASIIPLQLEGQILGCITTYFRYPKQFSTQERELLTAIANLCAQAVERARLYEEERKAREQAEEANALKLKFLGMISHELRTPLASIKGFSSTLLAKDITFSPDRQAQFLGVIDEEADKLSELVDQLLDLSRLQSGTLRIEPVPQAFDDILSTAMPQLQVLTSQHQLGISVPPDLPLVLADSERIAQVLVNLVGNAAKFSPISSPILINAARVNDHIQIDVKDEGIGIPPEEREKVFEAFRQVERKKSSRARGAGLGLAICKSVVEAHGGHIWIHDQVVGAMVSFVLPIVSAEALPDDTSMN